MQQNEKVLAENKNSKTENIINKSYNPIIPQFDRFDKDNMPAILLEIIMKFIKKLYPQISDRLALNTLLSMITTMLSYKHIKFKEHKNIKHTNYYAINLVYSGGGKDRLVNELDTHIFPGVRSYQQARALKYYNDKKAELEDEVKSKTNKSQPEIRKMVFEVSSATFEGFVEDAKIINEVGYGSLFVKIPELGLFLNLKDKYSQAFLTGLFNAYDGVIESKSIKNGKREETLVNIPVNTLMYSDPSLFKTTLKELFDALMQIGLARRAIITFQLPIAKTIEPDPLKAYETEEKAYNDAISISNKLYQAFQNVKYNTIYEMTKEAYINVFYPYKIYLTSLYNSIEDNSLLQKEVSSRELKVLKLACVFAALNHPTVTEINDNDFLQSINVVNYLSKDFGQFLKYKPERNEDYVSLLEELIDNVGKTYTMTSFVNIAHKHGFNRRYFRQCITDEISCLAEMASEKGYVLKSSSAENNINNATYINFYKKNEMNMVYQIG